MSGGNIDMLMQIWATLHPNDGSPFHSHKALYKIIDSIEDGDAPWQKSILYHPDLDDTTSADDLPSWKKGKYEVWFRDPKKILKAQLSNPNFKNGIDYAPKVMYNDKGERVWENFMSGNWAWDQCVS